MSPSILERIPPHSIEAEQGVLGCCILDPNCVGSLSEAGLEEGWLYDLRHQALWRAISVLWQAKSTLDLITLGQKLKDDGSLDVVGGLAYLSSLMDAVPSVSNLAYYLDIVREKALLRRLLKASVEIQASVFECDVDASLAVDAAESKMLAVRGEKTELTERGAKQMARSVIDRMQDRMHTLSGVIPTGYKGLDKHLTGGGLKGGQSIVLAGRPGLGKTALAGGIVRNVCEAGFKVGWFSLEMPVEELEDRLASEVASVEVARIGMQRHITEAEARRMTVAMSKMQKWHLRIDDQSEQTMPRIRSILRRWKKQGGLDLVVIDYLQLVSESRSRGGRREEEVSRISRDIKIAAKELKVPIISLCQLNREIEKEKARKPRLADLRESGSIEQDADMVWALYNCDPEKEDDLEATIGLTVLKQRGGAKAVDCRFRFEKTYCRFSDFYTRPE